ncbi:Tim44 domain-containing protein [Oxalobacteraceae bacterium OM1]|nr:Tim44 domain-containing protein [Oxalobacteraceae bacterium OM1]
MKKFLIGLVVAVSAMSVLVPVAEAKRMGGGGSIGRQSQSIGRQGAAPAQQAPYQQQAQRPAQQTVPAAAQQRPSSPWKGILGGALLGLGLGALFSHLGIGGAMAGMLGNLLMIALLVFAVMFIVRMVRRKQSGEPQPAFAGAASQAYERSATPEIGSRVNEAFTGGTSAGGAANDAPFGIPAGFDTNGFLRHAKTYFIRLQAAWDKGDVNDLREFTTPEMFAELKQDLLDRGSAGNHTDVVALDAQLLGIETIGGDYMASVKFSGMIREAENAAAEPFTEVWNLSKPVSGQGGWVLAGIQQLS